VFIAAGNLIIFTDGSISDLNTIMKKQLANSLNFNAKSRMQVRRGC